MPPTVQDVRHPFGNAPARVYGAYFTTGGNLEVQLFARRVVIALFHGVLFRLFAAVTLMLVALGGGDAF